MRVGGLTDRGKVREVNQDNYLIDNEKGLYVLCDGMGGHDAGEQASNIAVQTIKEVFDHYDVNTQFFKYNDIEKEFSIKDLILLSLMEANLRILASSSPNINMGTTAIVCFHHNNTLYIGHIGDSRVYLIRQEQIEQITEDHSVVQQLLKAGVLTQLEASLHPYKNIITKCLGIQTDIEPDIFELPLEVNDIVLICSDGLSNMVNKEEIKRIIIESNHPDVASQLLVDTANNNGGTDNITVIVMYNN